MVTMDKLIAEQTTTRIKENIYLIYVLYRLLMSFIKSLAIEKEKERIGRDL